MYRFVSVRRLSSLGLTSSGGGLSHPMPETIEVLLQPFAMSALWSCVGPGNGNVSNVEVGVYREPRFDLAQLGTLGPRP